MDQITDSAVIICSQHFTADR
jgi:hypothetical protein